MLALLALLACNPPPSDADLDQTRGGRIDVFFNDPGTRPTNLWEPDAEDVMIDLVNQANATIDMAVMGFTRQPLIDALIAAFDRGVELRMVGDADHLYNSGYEQFRERHIPMSVGNGQHIMHDKFLVVDDRFVFCGTANWSNSDLRQNSNNFAMIDSPAIAADFTTEFEQMFEGAFGHMKVEIDNGRVYQVGDTTVEVWFSPNEDAMGRILEYVEGARESVRFTIFAFTKDQVGSAFIRKQAEFAQLDLTDPLDDPGPFGRRTVAGVIDQSQLHSNGQYHEVYRLMRAGIPVRMDGNDNTEHPGDYQAGGGRLHSKTMLIDAHGENPVAITGSFNWSAAATQSNDEYLLVLKGPRVAELYDEYFTYLWDSGRTAGGDRASDGDLEPGDVVINEIMWYGVNDGDDEGNDEFVELRNRTDAEIDLSMWSIGTPDDFVVGFPPGSVIAPNGLFTILDHTLERYQDGVPQDELSAYSGGDMVLNPFNDNRQSRLYLKDGALDLTLKDPDGVTFDAAGDGGPAFAGGPVTGGKIASMERDADPGDGTEPGSWHAATVSGSFVNGPYQGTILATPGEENSD